MRKFLKIIFSGSEKSRGFYETWKERNKIDLVESENLKLKKDLCEIQNRFAQYRSEMIDEVFRYEKDICRLNKIFIDLEKNEKNIIKEAV